MPIGSFGECLLDKPLGKLVGRIRDNTLDAGDRREREIIGDPTIRQAVILDRFPQQGRDELTWAEAVISSIAGREIERRRDTG